MMIIEPPAVYQARIASVNPPAFIPQPVEPPSTQESKDKFWEQILFETLKLERGLPVKIVSLVSAAVKWGDFGRRADRENRKVELLRLVGRLIQQGRLCRFSRNYVVLPPEDSA